jgi:ABC-2 type transport system permease protein
MPDRQSATGGAGGVMTLSAWTLALRAIVAREVLRFIQQRERFAAALVRPLLWLIVFAAGFRMALGVSITPPYETYITYETYIVPGLIAMIQLFHGMQSALSMIYDREMGSMRVLLVSPLPRWYLLCCRLVAATAVSITQVYVFLLIAFAFGIDQPAWGYVTLLPGAILTGLMLSALGLLLSSTIRQLENFAAIMNFIIFPMFFLSSALYPLWKMQESSVLLYQICSVNPFTHAVELLRFALYGQLNESALGWTLLTLAVALVLALLGYSPSRGIVPRRTVTPGE